MPPKKIVVKKKKKSIVLSPRNVEVFHYDDSTEPSPASQTLHIPDPDEDEDEDVLDNSASGVVELNSSTSDYAVEQRPLEPESAEESPDLDLTQDLSEPTFKFFCYRCGQKLKVPSSWANKSTNCARCEQDVVIPPPLTEQET